MSDLITAALIAVGVSRISLILTFIVGLRSVRRSVATLNGQLGELFEARIGQVDSRLGDVERSLTDLRERFAFRDGFDQGRDRGRFNE